MTADDELRAEIAELHAVLARWLTPEYVRKYPTMSFSRDAVRNRFPVLAGIVPDLHRLYGVEIDTTGMATDEDLYRLLNEGGE